MWNSRFWQRRRPSGAPISVLWVCTSPTATVKGSGRRATNPPLKKTRKKKGVVCFSLSTHPESSIAGQVRRREREIRFQRAKNRCLRTIERFFCAYLFFSFQGYNRKASVCVCIVWVCVCVCYTVGDVYTVRDTPRKRSAPVSLLIQGPVYFPSFLFFLCPHTSQPRWGSSKW